MNGLSLWQSLGVLAVPTFGVSPGIVLNGGQRQASNGVERSGDGLDRRMEQIEDTEPFSTDAR